MKYVNSNEVIPKELIDEIRKYVEGVYLYIPVAESGKYKRTAREDRNGLSKRNIRIYDDFLRGTSYNVIADKYCLSEKSIRRIVLAKRREMETVGNMVKEALKQWGISAEPVQINHSSWKVNDTYVIKAYGDQKALKRNIEMFGILAESGIPVPKVVDSLTGDPFVSLGDKKIPADNQVGW